MAILGPVAGVQDFATSPSMLSLIIKEEKNVIPFWPPFPLKC